MGVGGRECVEDVTFIFHPWCLLSWEDRFWGKTPGFSPPTSSIPFHWGVEVTFLMCEKTNQQTHLLSSLSLGTCLPAESARPLLPLLTSPSLLGELGPCKHREISPGLESTLSHCTTLSHLRHVLQHPAPRFPLGSSLRKVCVHNFHTSCRNRDSPCPLW